ncbi:MAG TPA: ATP-dependent zinc metalloprotease FtsH [Vicinamibacterales bacterium]|jgi:cell division protease FtsH|nr:ATP-dependent zinc metalloprotease FtsH [Vicinamibacterales bacterium]
MVRLLPRVALVLGILALVGGTAFYWRTSRTSAPTEIAFSEFLRHVDAGRAVSVTVTDAAIDVALKDRRIVRTVPPPGFFGTNAAFVTDLARRGVLLQVKPIAPSGALQYGPIGIAICFMGLLGYAVYKTTSGRLPSMEGRARTADPKETTVRFSDVAGVDEAKDEVAEIVAFLREPQRFQAVGGRIPRGVLLVGPPGTGKTLLARAIAGEAGVPFLFASGSDFVEMYAGVGASRVRRLFRDARKHGSCIVFIDELDAVGRARGGHSLSHEEREQTLNQLLVEMDGFDETHGIVVIAATNRADILDHALLRPGRFDRQVTVSNPDLKGRNEILRVHLRKVTAAPDVNVVSIARGTPGFSGADLANVVNEAALLAGREGRSAVTTADLEAARDKVMMGAERRSIALTEAERVNCAWHEAGHAVVAAALPQADPLHKVTIIPRGRAMGVTMQLPEIDRHTYTKEYLNTQVAILMGGRAAEELFMEHMTSGASNDIERATDIAAHMVCEFGMSPLGPLAFSRKGQEDNRARQLSEESSRRVDAEIQAIVMRAYDRARSLLETHRDAVGALATTLLDLESLEAEEIASLLERHGVARRAH